MNYNTLMNKPTINYREIIGDNTVSEVGGMTEEEFNTLLSTDLAAYYTKAQIDELFARSFIYKEKSGSIVTFDCPTNTNGISEVTSEIVAVQAGTGDPSPTNIRPIIGWDDVNVCRTGINLWDEQTELGMYNNTTGEKQNSTTLTRCKNPIKVNPSSECYLNIGSTSALNILQFDEEMNYLGSSTLIQNTTSRAFTVTANTGYIVFYFLGTTYNNDISINYPSTDTEYHAYSGTTYTTALKDGQGNPMTCYGGTLDVVSGELTVDRIIKIFDGSENWQKSTSGNMYYLSTDSTSFPYIENHTTYNKANIYKFKGFTTGSYFTFLNDGEYLLYRAGSGTIREIAIKNLSISTVEDFKASLASNPLEVIYEINPQTIPQDNLAIASVGGTNNIWADSGDVTVKALDRIIQG